MRDFDPTKDYYEVLAVHEDATQEEIEKMYRRQAVKHHPDRGGSEEAMKDLNEAHNILKDPATRIAYDAARRELDEFAAEPWARTSPSFSHSWQANKSTTGEPTGEDLFGRMVATAAFLGIGFLLLLFVETQYLFFLWPLRLLAWGLIGLGLYYAHAAFKLKQRDVKSKGYQQLSAGLFWLLVAGFAYLLFLIVWWSP